MTAEEGHQSFCDPERINGFKQGMDHWKHFISLEVPVDVQHLKKINERFVTVIENEHIYIGHRFIFFNVRHADFSIVNC